MKVITCAELQDNLADILDYVIDDHAPVLINREDKQAVVIITLDDCNAFKETATYSKVQPMQNGYATQSRKLKQLKQRVINSVKSEIEMHRRW